MSDRFSIYLSKDIYALEAIQKALYAYSDKLSSSIEDNSKNQYILNISTLDNYKESIENLEKDLLNEINDHCIRIKISEETKDIRNLILAHAFSKTPLIEK